MHGNVTTCQKLNQTTALRHFPPEEEEKKKVLGSYEEADRGSSRPSEQSLSNGKQTGVRKDPLS